jgi:hypothetical protein
VVDVLDGKWMIHDEGRERKVVGNSERGGVGGRGERERERWKAKEKRKEKSYAYKFQTYVSQLLNNCNL